MAAPKKPLLALLQWVGGEHNVSYTAGVPVDWIKDFNPDTFDPKNEAQDVSYVIEWRENKKNKMPKKGWKCYDARVIKTSRRLKSLEKQITILEGLVSPLRPVRTLETIKNNLKNPLKRNSEDAFKDSTDDNTTDNSKDNNTNGQQQNSSQPGTSGLQAKKKKGNSSNQDQPITEVGDDENVPIIEEDPEQPSENEEEVISNQQIHRDNQSIKEKLNTLLTEMRGLKETEAEMIQRQGINRNPQPDADDQVEIGHDGSNVFIRRNQWETANSRDTFQSMSLSLVRALFDEETLLRSNFKGGVSKIKKNAPQRPGLDSNIMAAIRETVKRKYPAEFKQTLFGISINNMMEHMRRKNEVAADIEDDEGVE